jgi:signal transduction histidine kinase
MGEIIDKVVEMESIEGGKKELQLGNENIYEITHTAVDFLTDRYSQKDVELIINHNDLDWVEVNIDASVFRYNILNNLLTNALKFSSTGSKVEVNFTRQDHYILVEIRDYGIGIPKDMYDSIFDPSKKTTLNGTSGESGTGFGMPLAHSCTQKMNGLLRFESKEENESPEDHGTSFFICFPISNNSNKIAA